MSKNDHCVTILLLKLKQGDILRENGQWLNSKIEILVRLYILITMKKKYNSAFINFLHRKYDETDDDCQMQEVKKNQWDNFQWEFLHLFSSTCMATGE